MSKRIIGFDVARFVAICGMVVVNYKLVMAGEKSGPEWLARLADLATGRAVATFVVLAGIGVTLMSRRAMESGDAAEVRACRWRILKRALFLFVVGLLYYPIWPADILHYYGLYMGVAALVLTASSRSLWALATAFTLTFCVLFVTLDYGTGWNFDTLTYLDFTTPQGFVRNLLFNGFHPVFPWTAFLLVGMWLGRQDLRNGAVRRRLLAGSIAVTVVTELISGWLVKASLAVGGDPDLQHVFGTAPMPPTPFYLLAGGGTAVAVIVLMVALTERFPGRWSEPFAYTGQLALTIYVAHVVVGMGLLEELGMLENQTLAFALAYSTAFCAVATLGSWAWRRRFAQGPLEACMRRLTDAGAA